MTNYNYHTPVLLHPSVNRLITDPNGIYVDVTFGGGGHSAEILKKLDKGKLIAFDQDADAEKNAERFKDKPNFLFVKSNFSYIRNFLRLADIDQIDGLLADLGVSSHQFDIPERGFSFRKDAPLDMRMNTEHGQTAADILENYEAQDLFRIFKLYGELHNARKVANIIVKKRADEKIRTSKQLNDILMPLSPRNREFKYLAKAYQALRIEVNREMQTLEKLLMSCEKIVKKGGRIVFISYHSLEDRLVKNYIKSGNIEGKLKQDVFGNIEKPFQAVHKKVILPENEELEQNKRAGSAKLRIAERI